MSEQRRKEKAEKAREIRKRYEKCRNRNHKRFMHGGTPVEKTWVPINHVGKKASTKQNVKAKKSWLRRVLSFIFKRINPWQNSRKG